MFIENIHENLKENKGDFIFINSIIYFIVFQQLITVALIHVITVASV